MLGWSVVIGTTSTMGAAMALSIIGALDIYEGTVKSDSYALWKAGSALVVLIWVFQLFWSIVSIFPRNEVTYAPTFQGSTAVCISEAIILCLECLLLITSRTASSGCYHCTVFHRNPRYLYSCRGLHTAKGPESSLRINRRARCTLVSSGGLRDTHVDYRGPSNKTFAEPQAANRLLGNMETGNMAGRFSCDLPLRANKVLLVD